MSEEDTIEKFRRLAAPRRRIEPARLPGERLPYVAFDCKDNPIRLDIRGRTVGHRVPYGYMPLLTYTPWTFDKLMITVSNLVIVIRGERLEAIADAIGWLSCVFIQEYDPEHFLEPTDPKAPLVRSIESKLRHGMEMEDE